MRTKRIKACPATEALRPAAQVVNEWLIPFNQRHCNLILNVAPNRDGGPVPATQTVGMTIVLPVRNQAALTSLLSELYDPSSPSYHHFLTVQQFTDQFGPTAQDYEDVITWAKEKGLAVAERDTMTPDTLPITRRAVLRGCAAACAASAVPAPLAALTWSPTDGRPSLGDRHFRSPVVEAAIARIRAQIADPVLAAMFERCFPNTLDTTVYPGTLDGRPDTFVITGDIDAMWLRDSSAQVDPYIAFAKEDAALARLIAGVIRRQTRCILIDP